MKSFVCAVALTALLAGCAAGRLGEAGFDPLQVRQPDVHRPNVFVGDDGTIVVDQEPIRVPRSEGKIVIVWALAYTNAYTFPEDGIRLIDPATQQPPPGAECAPQGAARKLYRCAYTAPLEPRAYKYAIKVNGGKPALQPSVYND